MHRIQILPGKEETTSLQEALAGLLEMEGDLDSSDRVDNNHDKPTIQIGTTVIEDPSQTIASLGLQRGTLISLVNKNKNKKKQSTPNKRHVAHSNKKSEDRWDPFPDIAKDYQTAVRQAKIHRSTKTGMSYADIAKLQASLHHVQPQEVGPLTRVYVCSKSATRFKNNCQQQQQKQKEDKQGCCRIGLLLGTIHKERVNVKQFKKAKTSLSSQTESSQYCQAAKVQALWEPPSQRPTTNKYDAKAMSKFDEETDPELQRVFRIANLLGLQPIGWIFAYSGNRHNDDSLPVYAPDAKVGALLQIATMQKLGREEGSKFVTVAMQVDTGAAEAFQLSDVCVQMIAEDLWDINDDNDDINKPSRFVATKHAIVVDGKETQNLDSVLCLVNMAMLTYEGLYAGTETNSVNKRGGVTNKIKKAILSALDASDDGNLLETLCDLNLLVSLDKNMAPEDMQQVCTIVRKYARGQKKGTQLDDRLKLLLRSLLNQ
jgi:hypothetical protein